jgi:transcriptional regulator with XRE-family HTH domain
MLSTEDESPLETPYPLFSPRAAGPTVQRLMLGGHLRRLREQAGMTTERAAASIRGSRSKIDRMEYGRVGFKERDIADLLTLYGVTGGPEREALLNLAKESNTPGWWQTYSDVLPTWVEPYFGLEAAASFIREFELQLVPGLLQTEEYARAVIRLGNLPSEEEVVRRTQARMSRQQILNRENPPKLRAVLDEGALRRVIGDRDIMQAQLEHLIEMCDHPNITLQILPFSAGAHRAMGGPFTIFRYTEPELRDVVYMEQLTSALYLDKPSDVDAYLEVIEEVCLQAMPSAKTTAFIKQVASEMQALAPPRPGGGQWKAASTVSGEFSKLKASAHENIPSPGHLDEESTLAVTIYLSDESIHDQVEAAVDDWLADASLIVDERDEPIIGSWFRRMRAAVKQAVHTPAAQDALLTAAHAVDTRMVLAQDAAVAATLLQGVAPVIASLQPTKDAVVRAGAVLIVKTDWVVQVHQLTAAQQVTLNHQPQLLSSPIATIAALQLNGMNGNGAVS